jgi:protein phosphatase
LGGLQAQHPIVLLENAPIGADGQLYPTLTQQWNQVPPVRQVYWLWQILQLWEMLHQQGVAASLLEINNLHVDGWRVRLRELYGQDDLQSLPRLSDLGAFWLRWFYPVAGAIQEPLQTLCQQLQDPTVAITTISDQLNRLLIQYAAQQSLHSEVAGATDAGIHAHGNEDYCYPTTVFIGSQSHHGQAWHSETRDLTPYLGIICDGIGQNDRGEVASLLAVQALKPQIRAFLNEISQQADLLPPGIVIEQLETIIRVVNNLIAAQNDAQHRVNHHRMGTTLLMTLQLPQAIPELGISNSHELYVVNIGDSRCYWITPDSCHRLTIDDHVAALEVSRGRSLYRQALLQPESQQLTQGLGLGSAESLFPTLQRFIVEEDGILLLCSDGLTQGDLIEQHWQNYISPIFRGESTLETAVQALITLAHQHTGDNNASIILTHYQIFPVSPLEVPPEPEVMGMAEPMVESAIASPASVTMPLTSSLRQRLATTSRQRQQRVWGNLLRAVALLLVGGLVAITGWWQLMPGNQQSSPQPSPTISGN